LETLFELPALLVGQRPTHRHRVAVMSTTGGGAALVVDRLGTVGVDVVPPSDRVVENLAAKGIAITRALLTDLTHAGTRAEVYGPVLNELLASDHCDLVIAVAGSSAQFQPELAVEPVINADRHGKPLAMFIAPHAVESLERLSEAGIAGFRTPESCVDAVRAWTEWTSPSDEVPLGEADLGKIREMLAIAHVGTLNERDASALFSELGIPFAPIEVIKGPEERVNLVFPVAVKVLSADITHKTDSGAVVLGVTDAETLETAARTVLERVRANQPSARIDGLLVQQMESGLAEVILGFRRDPLIGPVVALGVGGVLAEVYQDYSVRMAPVGFDEARTMIEEVRGLVVLNGFRGLPAGDIAALCDAIVAMSQLAYVEVAEAEINPLLVHGEGQGVVGVDALVVLAEPEN
jgi:acetate---CoA ligase (ADP-forming)